MQPAGARPAAAGAWAWGECRPDGSMSHLAPGVREAGGRRRLSLQRALAPLGRSLNVVRGSL